MNGEAMKEIVQRAVESAKKHGAAEVAAEGSVERDVEVDWRDGKLEAVSDATTCQLNLGLYVDGRYSAVSTSDLRPDALDQFIGNAAALARALAKDPYRALPDPELYRGQASAELQLADPAYEAMTAERRRHLAEELEAAARAGDSSGKIISVSTGAADGFAETWRVHSNGFEGYRRETQFELSAAVTMQDGDGRRPQDSEYAAGHRFSDLPAPKVIGRAATERTLARIGAKKGASALTTVVVDRRTAGGLVRHLTAPLFARTLQQKRSMFEGKQGAQIGSALLSVEDDPLIVKGLGSQLFDEEGLAARRFPLFEGGVLRSYYVDNYYGRKLGMRPTTAKTSNLAFQGGSRSAAELIASVKDGILVTAFLGGNSNETTGDFSHGIQGARIRDGKLAEPISEMNLSGNHLDFWKRLVGVGNDPFPYSRLRTPTLVFEGAQVAGT